MNDPIVTIGDAQERREDWETLLRALVAIESPTGDAQGNLAAAVLIEEAMTQAGGAVTRLPAPELGVHLLGRFGRRAKEDGGRAPLLVLGHMDTVHPLGTLERFPLEMRQGRLHGPGVYDMKGGVVATLMALRLLAEGGGPRFSDVVFLVTCDEEWGSPHSRPTIESLARSARAALVVEPCVPGGGIKSRRKGVADYDLHLEGRAAHAGIEPEAGASAVHEAAHRICEMLELANPEAGTTVNVGVVRGGTAENVVAERASCTIDVRFWSLDEARRVDAALRKMSPDNPRCTLRLEGGINRGALEETNESRNLFIVARDLARELGFALGKGETGGGSDGNLTSAVGCPTLDGLGPDGAGAHTLKEHILLDDMPRRIALMAGLLSRL